MQSNTHSNMIEPKENNDNKDNSKYEDVKININSLISIYESNKYNI
jgi:hypothetical protein